MEDRFLVPEELLLRLSSTRQGRFTVGGYNYQASYAAARLSAMLVRQPILGLTDWPTSLRYDRGEDLDEVCNDGFVCFTQCKRVTRIGQPALLADILVGFAPKWLWTPENRRACVRFQLVCTDARFFAGRAPWETDDQRDKTAEHFVSSLVTAAAETSDRAQWQQAADDYGHRALFDELWSHTQVIYLPDSVYPDHPAGKCLHAELEALNLLLRWGQIHHASQQDALDRVRRVLHDNLIEFDPTSDREVNFQRPSPRHLERANVALALFELRPDGAGSPQPLPFQVVDPTFLRRQREKPPRPFVGRPPEWADIVNEHRNEVKFLEREQTSALREAVLRELLEPIERGTDQRLHAVFVVGAPGEGKTTLARCVAAQLVEEGRVVVADVGVNHYDPRDEDDQYIRRLSELANAGRPVLLLLDDPLYADSAWIGLLHKLARPGLPLAVLAASPEFLYDHHHKRLRGLILHEFEVPRPSIEERAALARLYSRDEERFREREDDFLVLVMEAAAGRSFDTIIERMWETLNDGYPIVDEQDISQLKWSVRAFLIVCFFHRAYMPCPQPLLHSALELSGGSADGTAVANALRRMRDANGWGIFRLSEHERQNWAYQGLLASTAHSRIAQRAWQVRPLGWCDVGELAIRASVGDVRTVRYVGELATRLAQSEDELDQSFVARLVDSWAHAATTESLDLRSLYDLITILQASGSTDTARRLTGALISRAKPLPDGWLAALGLWFLSRDEHAEPAFPSYLDLERLIVAADFSMAPSRAVEFESKLPEGPNKSAFCDQLLRSFDGELRWSLDGSLLAWLLAKAPRDAVIPLLPSVMSWLDSRWDDTAVRPQYLSFLLRLERECDALERDADYPTADAVECPVDRMRLDQLMRDAASATAKWLGDPDHRHDTSVRTKYLDFVLELPAEFVDHRRAAANETAGWLNEHEHDTAVRARYLTFVLKLPVELVDRRDVALQTAEWLSREEHQYDTSVRVNYLDFLLELPSEFDDLRRAAAIDTGEWLEGHPSPHVRTKWLSFLAATNDPGLATALERTLRSFEKGDATGLEAGALLGVIANADSPDLVCRAVECATSFVENREWLREDQIVVSSMTQPCLTLLATGT